MEQSNADDIGLYDVVSVIPSTDDGYYFLNAEVIKEKNSYWIFSKSARNKTWKATANELVDEYLQVCLPILKERLLKLYVVWVPDDNSLHHVVFEMMFAADQKNIQEKFFNMKHKKLKGDWFSLAEIKKMAAAGNLRSPELLDYVNAIAMQKENKKHKSPEEPEKQHLVLSGLTTVDHLSEVNKSHTLIDTTIDVKSALEQLVKQASFHNTEQIMIYREFLGLCFPTLLMNESVFENFMKSFGWEQKNLHSLFRSADVTERGALTYKEFLFILAACEPRTPHAGKPAELRCRYIFRYFDSTNSSRLSYDDVKRMLMMIRELKGQRPSEISVEKELDSCQKSVPIAEMTLGNFMRCIGELKFRGTSMLLRSPNSVIHFFLNRNIEPYWSLIDVKASLLFRDKTINSKNLKISAPNSSSSSKAPDDHTAELKHKTNSYRLCGHVFNVNHHGIQNISSVDEIPDAKSETMVDTFLSRQSVEMHNRTVLPSEVLLGLNYFVEKIETTDMDARKVGRKPKQAFHWGQVDMIGLGNHIIQVCKSVCDIFANEPRLTKIQSPVYVLGDLHGNYPDLSYYESMLWPLGLRLSPTRILFLGDYVDRGAFGVEIIAYLFSNKMLNPQTIYLVRGNHEVRNVQRMFTFQTECLKKFGKDLGSMVWEAINRTFDNMPLAALIDNKIFCCHGGIPAPWLCPIIESINEIPLELNDPEEQSPLAWDLMWNDPVRPQNSRRNVESEFAEKEGFAQNVKRGAGHIFTRAALNKFLNVNSLTHVIRAHEAMHAGFQVHQNGKLLTVFSSSHYCGGTNSAAIILVSSMELKVLRIDTSDLYNPPSKSVSKT